MTIERYFKAVALVFFFAGCAGLNPKNDLGRGGGETPGENITLPRDYVFPANLEFRPGAFFLPAAAPGVGSITREQRDPLASLGEDEKRAVTESFRLAYVEGLLRGLSLGGTLGGDLVHSWPPDRALSLAQNWQTREAAPNSWGLPSLVLAIRGAGNDAAFIVRGRILDQYGKSGGRDRANGAAGYGAPLGEEFPYRDGVAQWFEHGLIAVDAAGKGFFEETEPPKLPPDRGDSYAGEEEGIGDQFRRALRRALYSNLPDLRADGPLRRLEIPVAETLSGGTLYFQTFNQGSVLLLLPHVPDLPFRASIVAGAFLDAFLADPPDAGIEERLLRGLERYGPPLTDPYPALDGDTYRETQRFTRGWMTLNR
jgi:hypothetical protein